MIKRIIVGIALAATFVAGATIRPSGIHPPEPPTAKPSGLHEIKPPLALSTAEAGIYEQWVMAGPVCVKSNAIYGAYFARAASTFNLADGLTVVSGDCAGYPVRRIVQVGTYVDHAVGSCGKTGSYNNAYTWSYVYGKWIWVAERMIVWINVAPEAGPACFSKSTGIAHVVSHELGHALGLAHNSDSSVMGAWAWYWPTALDVSRVSDRYTL